MERNNVEKGIRLITALLDKDGKSIDELSRLLQMPSRTIYRYLKTFKSAGLTVTKIATNVYRLEKYSSPAVDFDKLVYFSDEEAYLINSLLDALVPTNALKKGLKEKLAVVYDSTAVADFVDRRSNASHVQNLAKAARGKKKVILRSYESGNSHSIRDRLIEPYGFTTDYIDVCAFDLEDNMNKIFKVSRIGAVDILDEAWEEEDEHQKQGMDIFRMTGKYSGHLKWQMTVMAKNLLVEEYPLAEKELKRQGNFWYLDVDICDYAGACRFFVGLAKEIKVIDSVEFNDYVKGYLKTTFRDFQIFE